MGTKVRPLLLSLHLLLFKSQLQQMLIYHAPESNGDIRALSVDGTGSKADSLALE